VQARKLPIDTHFGAAKHQIRAVDLEAPVVRGKTNLYLWKIKPSTLLTDALRHHGKSIR